MDHQEQEKHIIQYFIQLELLKKINQFLKEIIMMEISLKNLKNVKIKT